MPSPKQPSIIFRHDDDDIVTWEHLEDISTPSTNNESSIERRDPGNEEQSRSYHIENVAEVGSRWEMGARRSSRTGFGGFFAKGRKGC